MTDDDYPVLTQVLRTGGGARIDVTPENGDGPVERLDVRPVATAASLPPDVGDGTDAGPFALHDAEPPNDPSALQPALAWPMSSPQPTGRIDGPDVFALPQDDDAREAGASILVVLDEPEIDRRPAAADVSPAPDDWKTLGDRVRASVLEDLGARIDTEFDARIAQVMHAEIETAFAQLQSALRDHVAEALRDVVGRAVEVEVMRQRAVAAGDVPPA